MKSILLRSGVLALFLSLAGTAAADDQLGLGFKAGTLGFGLEATWRPLPSIDFRVGGNSFDYDHDGSQAGVNYDATLGLESFYATGNFSFPLSPFRVTAGIFSNGNEVTMTSANNTTFDIGGSTFAPADVGTLRSVTSFASTAPYLGIGYDFSAFGKVGLNLDFGVLWQGEPVVTLTADGLLANDPTFQAALETERLELENEMSDLKAWPVISLGFVVNFF